jgi:hypothetical protein
MGEPYGGRFLCVSTAGTVYTSSAVYSTHFVDFNGFFVKHTGVSYSNEYFVYIENKDGYFDGLDYSRIVATMYGHSGGSVVVYPTVNREGMLVADGSLFRVKIFVGGFFEAGGDDTPYLVVRVNG